MWGFLDDTIKDGLGLSKLQSLPFGNFLQDKGSEETDASANQINASDVNIFGGEIEDGEVSEENEARVEKCCKRVQDDAN